MKKDYSGSGERRKLQRYSGLYLEQKKRDQRSEDGSQMSALSFVAQRAKKNDQRSDVSFDPFFIARLRRMKARRAKEEG
jgi:hypothetical protein